MGDHTTADDSSRYRTKEKLAEWQKKDPIDRLKTYLITTKKWTEDQDTQLYGKCTEEVENAVKEYEGAEPQNPVSMFTHIYADMPWHLKEQMEEVKNLYDAGGKSNA